MQSLHLIKGQGERFRLINKVCHKWRSFQIMLKIPGDLDQTFRDSHMRWNYVMERWLSNAGSYKYPPTWKGLHMLLEDVECVEVAKKLKKVVDKNFEKKNVAM